LSSAETRYLKINFDEVLSKLRKYASSKARTQSIKTIVLTGSLAKGNYTGTSDADVLVIAEGLPADFLERYKLFADPTLGFDLEPRAYTLEEFVNMIHKDDLFALEALQIGMPLHGEQFFQDLRDHLTKQRSQALPRQDARAGARNP